jgi:hypothetical protein
MPYMKQGAKKRRWKFRGIGADAVALGVNRMHLHLVLEGKRHSPNLLARYDALKAFKSKNPMPRDTKNIQKLLTLAQENRDLVRQMITEGAPMEHIYDDLGNHVQIFSARLKELEAFNASTAKNKTDSAGNPSQVSVKHHQ